MELVCDRWHTWHKGGWDFCLVFLSEKHGIVYGYGIGVSTHFELFGIGSSSNVGDLEHCLNECEQRLQ